MDKKCRICGETYAIKEDKIVDGRAICPICGGYADGWLDTDKSEENFYWNCEGYHSGEYRVWNKKDEKIFIQNGKPYVSFNDGTNIRKQDILYIQFCAYIGVLSPASITVCYNENGEQKFYSLDKIKKDMDGIIENFKKVLLENGVAVKE